MNRTFSLGTIVVILGFGMPALAGPAPDAAIQDAFRLSRSAVPEQGWARFQRLQATHPGLPARTMATLQNRTKNHPDDGDALFHLGVLQVVTGAPGDAAATFAKATRVRPQDAYAYAYQGFALLESGAAKSAEVPLQMALKLDPKHPFATWALGQVYYRQGNRQQAARLLNQAGHSHLL
ncbi:MAG: tetratricopeptide repeat protein [Candidatus Sericytochromatia bacterium]|nr:tetratricopeptide repeat protein [Candidatus Sericytochromatia bacterium]